MPVQAILATLAFVTADHGRRVLLVHRNARPSDPAYGKFNGLGGKLEDREDIVAGIQRELREEAHLECPSPILRGTVHWPGFGKQGEGWFGFIFRVDEWSGEIPPRNPEGDLVWLDVSDLLSGRLPMWEGDAHFLPMVFDSDPRLFHGIMPYAGGRPMSWHYSRV